MSEPKITEIVREKYARAALRVTSGDGGCCGTASPGRAGDAVSGSLYESQETAGLPGLPKARLEPSRIVALLVEAVFVMLAVRRLAIQPSSSRAPTI